MQKTNLKIMAIISQRPQTLPRPARGYNVNTLYYRDVESMLCKLAVDIKMASVPNSGRDWHIKPMVTISALAASVMCLTSSWPLLTKNKVLNSLR